MVQGLDADESGGCTGRFKFSPSQQTQMLSLPTTNGDAAAPAFDLFATKIACQSVSLALVMHSKCD